MHCYTWPLWPWHRFNFMRYYIFGSSSYGSVLQNNDLSKSRQSAPCFDHQLKACARASNNSLVLPRRLTSKLLGSVTKLISVTLWKRCRGPGGPTLLAKKVVTPPLKTIKPMWIKLLCFHLAEIGMIWTRDCSQTKSDTTLGRHSMQGQVGSSSSETTV